MESYIYTNKKEIEIALLSIKAKISWLMWFTRDSDYDRMLNSMMLDIRNLDEKLSRATGKKEGTFIDLIFHSLTNQSSSDSILNF